MKKLVLPKPDITPVISFDEKGSEVHVVGRVRLGETDHFVDIFTGDLHLKSSKNTKIPATLKIPFPTE